MSRPLGTVSNLESRLLERVTKTPTCWIFTGDKTARGYGRLRVDGPRVPAHRISYELFVGPIGDGLVIDHLCRVTSCVNPEHLEAVTQRVNTLRGIGPTAANAAMTRCERGHEFTPENTYIESRGNRNCRACRSRRNRERWHQRKAARVST